MGNSYVKGKFFSDDPQLLQQIALRIQNEFAPFCGVSRPLPADRGDYFILVTIYKEAQR